MASLATFPESGHLAGEAAGDLAPPRTTHMYPDIVNDPMIGAAIDRGQGTPFIVVATQSQWKNKEGVNFPKDRKAEWYFLLVKNNEQQHHLCNDLWWHRHKKSGYWFIVCLLERYNKDGSTNHSFHDPYCHIMTTPSCWRKSKFYPVPEPPLGRAYADDPTFGGGAIPLQSHQPTEPTRVSFPNSPRQGMANIPKPLLDQDQEVHHLAFVHCPGKTCDIVNGDLRPFVCMFGYGKNLHDWSRYFPEESREYKAAQRSAADFEALKRLNARAVEEAKQKVAELAVAEGKQKVAELVIVTTKTTNTFKFFA